MESIEKGTPSSAAAADGKESELKIASSPSIKRRKSLKDFNFARLNSIGKVSFIHELLNFATHFYAGASYPMRMPRRDAKETKTPTQRMWKTSSELGCRVNGRKIVMRIRISQSHSPQYGFLTHYLYSFLSLSIYFCVFIPL